MQASKARQQKKQKRMANEGKLQEKRQEMDKAKARSEGDAYSHWFTRC